MKAKKIILVDDHNLVRNGLKELIQKLGPFQVIAEYENGKELIDSLPWNEVPDLLIMDVTMPEMDGEEAMLILNNKGIQVPVLIVTLNQDEQRMVRLFRLGVRGYLQKNSSAALLREGLEEIFRCGYYHNEFLASSLKAELKPAARQEKDVILEQLTERERHFLKLVCHEAEYTYDQIAGIMNVQHRTVDGYREALFEKFGIKSKTGLVLFVLKHQLHDQL